MKRRRCLSAKALQELAGLKNAPKIQNPASATNSSPNKGCFFVVAGLDMLPFLATRLFSDRETASRYFTMS